MMKILPALLALLISTTIFASETIEGVRVTNEGIEMCIMSNGCTEKSHFQTKWLETKPDQLTLIRLIPDHCKSNPFQIWMPFSFQELGILPQVSFRIKGEGFDVEITRQ